jgi:cyclopropane-fatty-acyl-phospholipid synthase
MTLQLIDNRSAAPESVPVAGVLQPIFGRIFRGPPPLVFEFWDGSKLGSEGPGRITLRSPDALRRIMWSPDELGIARAFVTGDLDVEGDVATVLRALQQAMPTERRIAVQALPGVLAATRSLGGIGKPPPPPPEEIVPRGIRHTLHRDRETVGHHYNTGNDFYRLVLGPSMTYSCARFTTAETTLEAAQEAKHELICRKLGLGDESSDIEESRQRKRILDVGCGWGSMAIHAAAEHNVDVVGVTLSEEQAKYARRRVDDLDLGDHIDIRVQDYREVDDGPFDAISSIGMAEHVGKKRMARYFNQLYGLLRPGGRMLNHAISSVGGSRLPRRSFLNRYVFPDGELLDVGVTALRMELAGFEVRDVENLREHYALTLRQWVTNLEDNWDEAVELVGEARARVWVLYMSGSINGFEDGGNQLNQTLGVRPHGDGRSDMPRTRSGWG